MTLSKHIFILVSLVAVLWSAAYSNSDNEQPQSQYAETCHHLHKSNILKVILRLMRHTDHKDVLVLVSVTYVFNFSASLPLFHTLTGTFSHTLLSTLLWITWRLQKLNSWVRENERDWKIVNILNVVGCGSSPHNLSTQSFVSIDVNWMPTICTFFHCILKWLLL